MSRRRPRGLVSRGLPLPLPLLASCSIRTGPYNVPRSGSRATAQRHVQRPAATLRS